MGRAGQELPLPQRIEQARQQVNCLNEAVAGVDCRYRMRLFIIAFPEDALAKTLIKGTGLPNLS